MLNGKPPSAYSRLIQYSDEDLWKWADEILDVIYDELNDDFQLIFVGTDFDAAILEKQCENAPHCIGFRKHNFEVSDPLQNRMKRLNQLIKKSGLTSYQKSIIDACFYVPSAFQSLLEDILALDVNNLFCSVRAQILGAKLAYEETPTSVLFLLAEDYDSGYECLRKIRTEKPAYILIIDGGSGALKVTDKGLFLRTSREEFFRTLFECLLQVPLTTAFRNCVESIHGGGKITYELEKIRSTVPIVSVIVGNEVEVGKSIRLDFLIEPETAQLPGLVCKMQNQETASCNGFNVYGLKEGTSTLEVYRQGSGRPFFIKEIVLFSEIELRIWFFPKIICCLVLETRNRSNWITFPQMRIMRKKYRGKAVIRRSFLLIKMVASQLSELASAESSALQRMFRHSVFAR